VAPEREVDIPGSRVDERVVARIWEGSSFDREALRLLELDLVFRGLPSDAGGPDYQEAILSTAKGRLLHGDVEFHVRSADWYRHRHHLDPAYNQVVLHVVWESDGEEIRRQDGRGVPTLALRRCVTGFGTAEVGNDHLFAHPCGPSLSALHGSTLRDRIEEAGIARLGSRAERFASDFLAISPDQTAYSALMEAMGFASNREAFRALAECVPYGWLMSQPAGLRAEVLLDAAGLGPPGRIAPPARLKPDVWRLARLRPGNHPIRRLVAISVLLERFRPSLADALAQLVLESQKPRELGRALTVCVGGVPVLGQGRADEIVVSVVLPLASACQPGRAEPALLSLPLPEPSQHALEQDHGRDDEGQRPQLCRAKRRAAPRPARHIPRPLPVYQPTWLFGLPRRGTRCRRQRPLVGPASGLNHSATSKWSR
jgi:Protein of unknown function (DUF2851)